MGDSLGDLSLSRSSQGVFNSCGPALTASVSSLVPQDFGSICSLSSSCRPIWGQNREIHIAKASLRKIQKILYKLPVVLPPFVYFHSLFAVFMSISHRFEST